MPDVQDEVLIAGFGRRGHAVGDIPGVRFKVQLLSARACILFGVHAQNDMASPASVPVAIDAIQTESCMIAHALRSFVCAVLSDPGTFPGASIIFLGMCTDTIPCPLPVYWYGIKLAWRAVTQFLWHMQVVKVAGVSLWALFREKKEKPRN